VAGGARGPPPLPINLRALPVDARGYHNTRGCPSVKPDRGRYKEPRGLGVAFWRKGDNRARVGLRFNVRVERVEPIIAFAVADDVLTFRRGSARHREVVVCRREPRFRADSVRAIPTHARLVAARPLLDLSRPVFTGQGALRLAGSAAGGLRLGCWAGPSGAIAARVCCVSAGGRLGAAGRR
jgi:hypothetical protein